MNFNKADFGLRWGLISRRKTIPLNSSAVEFGSGTGRNVVAMAKFIPGAIGYDLNPHLIAGAKKRVSEAGVNAQVVYGNAWDVEIKKSSLAVASVDMLIYLPKGRARKMLKKVWQGLKPNGLLHAVFAMPDDNSHLDEFFEFTLAPFPEEKEQFSYYHSCGGFYGMCEHQAEGVEGASFWTRRQAFGAIRELGPFSFVFAQRTAWWQNNVYSDGTERLRRAFYRVTVQKK